MSVDTAPAPPARTRFRAWAAPLVPRERIFIFRVIIYLFAIADTLWICNDPPALARIPSSLYRPILLRDVLHLPAPNPAYVAVLHIVLITAALLAASGYLSRIAGIVVLLAFVDWVTIGYSFSKVDHDQYAFFVALLALPFAGKARWGDSTHSEAAGFAIRCIQIGAVCCYFLSAVTKVRFGGWGWANRVVVGWAFARRGTPFAHWLLTIPHFARMSQWLMILAETASPALLFLRRTPLAAFVCFFCLFHAITWATLGISFFPLIVCLLAFAPLEKVFGADSPLGRRVRRRSR
ncbi:hypothetical protein [Spelaeicoccus albus]|uniref:HTTM domain-containing protein n=1 Tax=Spelaeicoccus albus TaxID=1280376 RepID=A0A7Z0IIM7_9MICO|nr:hypothetical protein [Spelaeicoccus albus]NYI68660.1 hypothetical protein [Spelaeicoccus albus]